MKKSIKNIFKATQLVIVASLFFGCNLREPNKRMLNVKVDNLMKLSSEKFRNSKDIYYSIEIHLENNTDSVIYFDVMSCSWQDNFVFNNKMMKLYLESCDSNYPITKQISPREHTTFKGIVQLFDELSIHKLNNIQLGFILIKKEEYKDQLSNFQVVLTKKLEEKDFIWSDEIIFSE